LKLINNNFNDIKEIHGFSKNELINIKRKLTKLHSDKADQTEIEEFLSSIFSSELNEFYLNYLSEIRSFILKYLINTQESKNKINFYHYHIKSGILNEIKKISNNLLNIKLNGQNTKRFLKSRTFLDELLIKIQELIKDYEDLTSQLEDSALKIGGVYDNYTYIWIESNKLKNLFFKINDLPNDLTNWEEFTEFYNYFKTIIFESTKKRERKKKDFAITAHFNDIFSFFNKMKNGNLDFYTNLIVFLYDKNIIEEYKENLDDFDEYVNIVDRKEIKNKIKSLINPIIKKLIENKLKNILNEIIELDKTFKLTDDKKNINLAKLLEQKISTYLPQIVDYYLKGLENKYQAAISKLKEYDEFKNIADFYSEKINILNSLVEEIEKYFADYDLILTPYEHITSKHKKIFSNIYSEIERRRNEYLSYLKTIRKERLRDSVRSFIYEKISEINEIMSKYQDETSLIVREEFPQLKKIQTIFSEYKENIQKIKDEVYTKLDSFKEKDIDIYQIIKSWEDNFTFKKQQISFLLSLLLNKLFKNFKDLIEEEKALYEHITEITDQNHNLQNIPLNFAISNILVDKLTEDELDERIREIQSKIENLNKEIELYRSELSNLKKNLADKVKLREGITREDIQCGVCRKTFDFAKDKIIKCPFCGAVFHYLCVAFWLSKYNSCPSCQNTFLDPNAGIFEE
jgi:hypothetical protein